MTKDKSKLDFKGFTFPNTTPVPDQLFDELVHYLTGSELKVLLYIVRRTFGFKKTSDNISLNQLVNGITKSNGTVLDRGTGLNKDTVVVAVKRLKTMNIIIATRRSSTKKGNEPTTYSLNILHESTTPLSENPTRGGRKIRQGLDGYTRQEQQTVLQETVRQQQQANTNGDNPTVTQDHTNDVVVASLLSKKISKKVAQDLARKFPADYILEKIDILDVLIESHDPNAPTSPAGWLRKAIEDDYAPPDWYKTRAEREALQKQAEAEAAEAQREREREARKREQWRVALIEQHRVSQKRLAQWAQTVSQVQEITVQEDLKRWLGKTLLISQKNGTATIAVPYEYASHQMSNSALEECQEILGQAVGRPVDLRLEVIPYPDSG